MSTASKKIRQQAALGRLQSQLETATLEMVRKRIAEEILELESNIASGSTSKERTKRHLKKKKKVASGTLSDMLSEDARLVASMPFAKERKPLDKKRKIQDTEQKHKSFWEQAPRGLK